MIWQTDTKKHRSVYSSTTRQRNARWHSQAARLLTIVNLWMIGPASCSSGLAVYHPVWGHFSPLRHCTVNKEKRWNDLVVHTFIKSIIYKKHDWSIVSKLTSSISSFLPALFLLLPLMVMSSTPDRILVTAILPFSCSFSIFSRKTSPSVQRLFCLLMYKSANQN